MQDIFSLPMNYGPWTVVYSTWSKSQAAKRAAGAPSQRQAEYQDKLVTYITCTCMGTIGPAGEGKTPSGTKIRLLTPAQSGAKANWLARIWLKRSSIQCNKIEAWRAFRSRQTLTCRAWTGPFCRSLAFRNRNAAHFRPSYSWNNGPDDTSFQWLSSRNLTGSTFGEENCPTEILSMRLIHRPFIRWTSSDRIINIGLGLR